MLSSVKVRGKITGSELERVLFGISSSAWDAALSESLVSTLRMFPRGTICLKVSIAQILFVLPEAFGP